MAMVHRLTFIREGGGDMVICVIDICLSCCKKGYTRYLSFLTFKHLRLLFITSRLTKFPLLTSILIREDGLLYTSCQSSLDNPPNSSCLPRRVCALLRGMGCLSAKVLSFGHNPWSLLGQYLKICMFTFGILALDANHSPVVFEQSPGRRYASVYPSIA